MAGGATSIKVGGTPSANRHDGLRATTQVERVYATLRWE